MKEFRIAYINNQPRLQTLNGAYKIRSICNVIGCADADENAQLIDCGLIDPECYYDCDLCDCICNSSDSGVSE